MNPDTFFPALRELFTKGTVILLAGGLACRGHGAEEENAAPVQKAPPPKAQQVEIESKFVEISGAIDALPDVLKEAHQKRKGAVGATLSPKKTETMIRTLSSTKGVDLLSAPRVTMRSKQRAKVEIVREFRYPTEFEKDTRTSDWKPKTYDTKNVGVTLDVTATVNADRTISLHMVPQVTEFEGFVYDDAAPAKAGAKPEASPRHGVRAVFGPKAEARAEVYHKRPHPIFNVRKIDSRATVKAGYTVVLVSPIREDVQKVEDAIPILGDIPLVGRLFRSTTEKHITRRLFVFVTARIAKS